MDPLEQYLQSSYLEEKREVGSIDGLIKEVWPVFPNFLSANGWPYEITDGDKPANVKQPSSSTNAMILFILAQLLGRLSSSPLLPTGTGGFAHQHSDDWPAMREKIQRCYETGLGILLDAVKEKEPFFQSGSFGTDDPFTFAWTMTLISDGRTDGLQENLRDKIETVRNRLRDPGLSRIKAAFEQSPDKILYFSKQVAEYPERVAQPLDHVFPLLRIVQLYEILSKCSVETDVHTMLTTVVRTRFFSRLHEQLSLSSIADASFDVAELCFSLEGYVITLEDPRSLDVNLIDRVFEVLRAAQDRSAYWRPVKPFITTPQGYALLPLSVEIANSLLRTCSRLPARRKENYFSIHIDLFRRYADWLYTRVARGEAPGRGKFVGWHSEHVYVPGKIHPWETSQVLSYFLHYREMLQDHVAATALAKAKLHVKLPKRRDKRWDEKSLRAELIKFEPLRAHATRQNGDSSPFDIYGQIITHYILPRLGRASDAFGVSYSMLLYGPPGTGKSTAPEQIANLLGWPLITVTPSDFIAGGEAEVENRAKMIFATLEEQSQKVILFDEIDRLILDRDSEYYHQQADMFQFMTPSMLIKLKDLRRRARCIFAIATNYEERVDSAAKRKGRIDHKFMIGPPDRAQRIEILRHQVTEAIKDRLSAWTEKKEHDLKEIAESILNQELTAEFGALTVLMTFGELKLLAAGALSLLRSANDMTELRSDAFVNAIRCRLSQDCRNAEKPSIRLASYFNRFRNYEKPEGTGANDQLATGQKPFTEFFVLVFVRLEVVDTVKLETEEQKVIEYVFNRANGQNGESPETILAGWVKDAALCKDVLERLPKK
jgi:MoxR-like ATPase